VEGGGGGWGRGGLKHGNMPQTNLNRICVDAKYSSATRGSGSLGCCSDDGGGGGGNGDGWENEGSTTTTTTMTTMRVEPEKWSDRKRMLLFRSVLRLNDKCIPPLHVAIVVVVIQSPRRMCVCGRKIHLRRQLRSGRR